MNLLEQFGVISFDFNNVVSLFSDYKLPLDKLDVEIVKRCIETGVKNTEFT